MDACQPTPERIALPSIDLPSIWPASRYSPRPSLSKPREVDGKTVQGINFFAPVDSALLHALQNPRVNIAGIRRSNLLPDLGMISPTRLSRQLRRLLDLGVFKRVTGTYRYYLTKTGRAATAAAERITEAVIVPTMI